MNDQPPARRERRTRLPAAERRRQILREATRLISERGFWGISVQDVADECGLTVNGVLHHVGSKDGLLIAVLDDRDRHDMVALLAEIGMDDPGDGERGEVFARLLNTQSISMAELSDAVVARNARQPEIVRLYSVLEAESLESSHPAHEYFRDRQKGVLDGLASLAPDGVDGPRLARQLLALMDGLQLQWLRDTSLDLLVLWREATASLEGLR